MTVNKSMITKSLVPGVKTFVGMAYGDVPEEHLPLFEVVKSNRHHEEDVMLSGMQSAQVKEEGAAVVFDDINEMWTARYQHETVAIGFRVTKEAFDDDLYDNVARAKSTELGRAMADTKQVKAAAIFNRGFSSSYVGGDGKALFATDHPTAIGTFSNKVSVDLSETALEDAVIAISKMTNNTGVYIGARAVSLHIPPELIFTAERILKSTLSVTPMTAGGNNVSNKNDINALKSTGRLSGGIHSNLRFTDPDAWFIKTSVSNGTKMYVREVLGMSNHTDFFTDNLLFKFRERYSFGWTDPRGWYGSEGA